VLSVVAVALEVGRDEFVPPRDDVDDSRDWGREIGRVREPLPVTLTLSLEERVLPREFDRTELGAVTGVRADGVVLVVD